MPPAKPSLNPVANWRAWADRAVARDDKATLIRKADFLARAATDAPDLKGVGPDERQALIARLRKAAQQPKDA